MKAADVLISARDRLAISVDNWTTHSLVKYRKEATDGACFCAVGAVVNAAGGFAPVSEGDPAAGDILDAYLVALSKETSGKPSGAMFDERAAITATSMLQLARTGKTHIRFVAALSYGEASDAIPVTSNSHLLKKECKRTGYEYRAGVVAARYLNQASVDMFGRGIIRVNDDRWFGTPGERYLQVLAAFDLAIKRAKRRHPKGG